MTAEPPEVAVSPPTEGVWRPRVPRPRAVPFVAVLEVVLWAVTTLAALAAAIAGYGSGNVSLLLGGVVAAVAFGLMAFSAARLFAGQGWARSTIVVGNWFRVAIGGLVLVSLAAQHGVDGISALLTDPVFYIALVVLLYAVAIITYLGRPAVRGWFSPIDFEAAKHDAKWALALLLTAILGLSGWQNGVWQNEPEGREDLSRILDLLVGEDALVFLLQLLGVLLVAALIASVVLAIRDPEPGDEIGQAGEEYSSKGYAWDAGGR